MTAKMNSGIGRPATIIDVARLAGVSFKTVSRVLNGGSNVSEETKAKVSDAMKELDYRPNHNARNLRAQKSQLIGIFFSNPSRNYTAEVLWGAMQRCHAEGYSLISEDCSDNSRVLLALRSEPKLEGAILTPPLCDDQELIDQLEQSGVPYVSISPGTPNVRSSVGMDDRAAARAMTQHLIDQGHKTIGFIAGPKSHTQAKLRELGYRDALENNDIDIDDACIIAGAFSYESGRSAAKQLFASPHPPTAIFASNDDMAAGVVAFAYKEGIDIPGDLSVAGFDDTPLASAISPRLTTVYQPSKDLASEAVALLLEANINRDREPQHRVLDFRLVLRESTGPVE